MAFKVPKYLAQNGIACENYGWLESGRSSEKYIYFISIKQHFNDANGRMKGSFTLS
jgi:hypothetical protein